MAKQKYQFFLLFICLPNLYPKGLNQASKNSYIALDHIVEEKQF